MEVFLLDHQTEGIILSHIRVAKTIPSYCFWFVSVFDETSDKTVNFSIFRSDTSSTILAESYVRFQSLTVILVTKKILWLSI